MPDFFDHTNRVVTNAPLFGLCDDSSPVSHVLAPATLEEGDTPQPHWIAEVRNPLRKEVEFFPLDNCISFTRADGTTDEICDALLRHDIRMLKFIELKNRNYSHSWFAKAASQLKTTIRHFRNEHTDSDDYVISAHISNPRRPRAAVSCKVQMIRFTDETGIPIEVSRIVNI